LGGILFFPTQSLLSQHSSEIILFRPGSTKNNFLGIIEAGFTGCSLHAIHFALPPLSQQRTKINDTQPEKLPTILS